MANCVPARHRAEVREQRVHARLRLSLIEVVFDAPTLHFANVVHRNLREHRVRLLLVQTEAEEEVFSDVEDYDSSDQEEEVSDRQADEGMHACILAGGGSCRESGNGGRASNRPLIPGRASQRREGSAFLLSAAALYRRFLPS